MKIKELPYCDRPREKVLKYGFKNISNSELLAILLRNGIKGKSSIELSYEILQKFNGLQGLINTNIKQLSSINGINEVKAIQILTAVELSKRINDDKEIGQKIIDGLDVYNLIGDSLKKEEQEFFMC